MSVPVANEILDWLKSSACPSTWSTLTAPSSIAGLPTDKANNIIVLFTDFGLQGPYQMNAASLRSTR